MKLPLWFAICCFCSSVFALEAPGGAVILTVSGNVSQPNRGKEAVFTMDQLTKLPQISFTTQTPWYDKPVKFTGPLLKDVLAAAGAKGEKITLIALNDYRVEIPYSDVAHYPVVLARLMNDKPMPIREKGPLFIVYPYDKHEELQKELYYTRSIWQLSKINMQ
ncbi:molybdopterin-dependent oxidoreductase [Iodobacter sp.]|uniref:molybdopterin-dependent oxidoreductase n=1 Tax=Iodobacter sp. TaxID=1915058 RepID=UPI0025FE5575|nr:molybdopterin-dependent oxidoreductase [Iodobacter sp.]